MAGYHSANSAKIKKQQNNVIFSFAPEEKEMCYYFKTVDDMKVNLEMYNLIKLEIYKLEIQLVHQKIGFNSPSKIFFWFQY